MAQAELDSGCIREQLRIACGRAFAWNVRWQGLKRLRENWVLEGHGFSRAVNDTAIAGFSR
jgi:hypothetical protein